MSIDLTEAYNAVRTPPVYAEVLKDRPSPTTLDRRHELTRDVEDLTKGQIVERLRTLGVDVGNAVKIRKEDLVGLLLDAVTTKEAERALARLAP